MADKKNQASGDEPVAFAQAEVDSGDQSKTQGPTAAAAEKASGDATEYPAGSHPIAPLQEQTHWAGNLKYEDMPDEDKPDPSTVANIQVREEWQPGVGPGEADK